MSKITIGVYKSFKNSGSLRFHRKNTKPHWKHYFFDSDDESFNTEWISSLKARILKLNVWKLRKFICEECGLVFSGLIKNDRMKIDCPECD